MIMRGSFKYSGTPKPVKTLIVAVGVKLSVGEIVELNPVDVPDTFEAYLSTEADVFVEFLCPCPESMLP